MINDLPNRDIPHKATPPKIKILHKSQSVDWPTYSFYFLIITA